MTNAEQIQRITETAKALRTKMETLYSELPNNPLLDEEQLTILKAGLSLKKEAAIFTAEERAFFDEIDRTDTAARQLLSDLLNEKKQIEKAEERESFYAESFRVLSLSQIMEENASDTEIVGAVISDLLELQALATGIGWERYEALMKKNLRRTLDEAKAIAEELQVVTTVEHGKLKVKSPAILFINRETDYYTAKWVQTLAGNPTFEEAERALKTLLYHHKKALSSSDLEGSLDLAIALKARALSTMPATEIPEEEYESYTTPTITSIFRYTGKLIRNLPQIEHNEPYYIDVKNRKQRKGKNRNEEVKANVVVSYDTDKLDIDILSIHGKPLDQDDIKLLNAILTLWENKLQETQEETAEIVVTPQILHQRVTNNENARISKEKQREYIERCIKLDCIKIIINAKDEAKAYYGEGSFNDDENELDILYGSILNIAIHPAIINGNRVANAIHIYGFNHNPIYQYAKATGQISHEEKKLLPTGIINKNSEIVSIDEYLRSRIAGRKGMGHIILVTSIFEAAGIDLHTFKEPKNKRKRVLGNIETLMNGYVKTGLISSWKYHSRGRVNKYSIEFFMKREKKNAAENDESLDN